MITPPTLITRLTTQDLEPVRAILEPSELHVDLEAELNREIALPWVLRETLADPPLAFLLAWSVADELHLLELACHPEHRRRGLARSLLSALVTYAREQRKRLVLLEVRQSNLAALALYESSGFQTTGVRRGYYSDTGEDALEMRITLNPETGQIVPNNA
ncbi:MAG TPA: ribosomal protein S18-alanine N-acetyltransferase [Polyangiaceae bacterium]|nr:ribosomal protein S18-alanine N-acetyltransferase [Polyangiaceae bacterium]